MRGWATATLLKNVVDLARDLLPTPPVPVQWRRRMLALAQAFPSVRCPILPEIENVPSSDPMCPGCMDEILQVRDHSLFVPRDFGVPPHFALIKPTLAAGFEPRALARRDAPAVPA